LPCARQNDVNAGASGDWNAGAGTRAEGTVAESAVQPGALVQVRVLRNARTCFDRLRAVLRLVRNEIGTELYRRENALYRDARRRLSAVWHSAARRRTLDKLVEQCDEPSILGAAAGTREKLAREHTGMSTRESHPRRWVVGTTVPCGGCGTPRPGQS